MTNRNFVIVEDDTYFLADLVRTMENQTSYKGKVHGINPCARKEFPSLEEVCEEIRTHLGENGVLLLDYDFGLWGYTGEEIAAQFPNNYILSISSSIKRFGDGMFTYKVDLRNPITQEVLVSQIEHMLRNPIRR